MEYLDSIIGTISLTMGVAWASGINLYATLLVLGLLGATGNMVLPPALDLLADPMVIGAAGLMYAVEFFADKVPGIDTGWDSIHTFIRIPAGVALAAGAASVGEMSPPLLLAAAIVGGGVTTASHLTKSGSRVLINTSPEPFTNWAASVTEDVAVFAGLWAALYHPVLFLVLLVLFVIVAAWLLPKIWRGVKKVFGFLGRLFTGKREKTEPAGAFAGAPGPFGQIAGAPDPRGEIARKIETLNDLLEKGHITRDEFEAKKRDLLDAL